MVRKIEFPIAVFNLEDEILVFYVASLAISDASKVDHFYKAPIVSLQVGEASKIIPPEYSYFADAFSRKWTTELPKYIWINDHTIDLVKNNQPPYE